MKRFETKPNPARDTAREIAKRIAKMDDAAKAALLAKFPGIMTIEGRPLSAKNTMLAVLQCGTATVVGGFRQWIKAGRCVRKGEHGIYIWIPTSGRAPSPTDQAAAPAAEPDETRFIMGAVFDVTQTDEIAAESTDAPTTARMGERLAADDLVREQAVRESMDLFAAHA